MVETTTHCKFVSAFLAVHGLNNQYSPGIHSGPAFKIYWTWSLYIYTFILFILLLTSSNSGGQGSAITIDTDCEFQSALASITKKCKENVMCQVSVTAKIGT